ncbi:ATP-binding protein [Desulfofundulus sp. TPOSR]|uniref:ATP-binding protein n=1 Tax=Desulfofundulus sp. TPOSR TaxID=2714340 RepID=UPI0014088E92|nr:ATP-binding protein [Desulfofundulus sp. TPOSR]NHM27117.1 ATP-binding protein [Desulfofundulus sp. TPOSR]
MSAVKLTLPIIIILDEVGYLTLDKTASDHLFQLITRAYENVALIITWLNSYNLRLGLLVIQVEKGD